MMYFRHTILLHFLFLLNVSLLAQSSGSELEKYTPDFRFSDGIYSNFSLVKTNNPIPKARIITDVDLFARDFFEQIIEKKEVAFYDDNGVLQTLNTSNIWGYGRNGVLYVQLAGKFHRISFVGSICHFVATITTYNPSYNDPYYSSNYYNSYYRSPSTNHTSTEVRQYLFDFETGKVLEFDVRSVEILLMKDPELYDEFMMLRRKKKKQMKFVYIRRYNEKYPIYFPKK